MGSVKVDLHSKERFYSDLTLSDIDVLQLLIEYRNKYDKYAGFESNNAFTEAGQIADVNTEIIATYASIDQLIKQCKFDEKQLKILELLGLEYELKEIAEELGLKHGKEIRKRLNSILKQIANANTWNWRKMMYVNKLDLKTKKCSKCRDDLPAMPEFFRGRSDNKGDGFYNKCLKCEE